MLEKFTKSLTFISVDTSNMNYSMCDKNIYKFEDEKIDKQWRSFFAFPIVTGKQIGRAHV